jgi:LacI family transcriptional regulator
MSPHLARRHIVLGLNTELSLARQVFRGVSRYARIAGDWRLRLHVARKPGEPVLPEDDDLKVDGVIGHFTRRWQVEALLARGVPFVNVSNLLFAPAWPVVTQDDDAVGSLAAQHFLDRGFRRFAFVTDVQAARSFCQRGVAFSETVRAAGFACSTYPDQAGLRIGPPAQSDDSAALERWLMLQPTPLAIFAHNDTRAVQVLRACWAIGRLVPDQVAVLGVDNDDVLCELAQVSLSSVALGTFRVGYAAAELLDALMRDPDRPPPQTSKVVAPEGVVTRRSSDVLAVEDADVAAALRFIRERAGSMLEVDDVCSAVAVSRRRLERRFRETIGRTPHEEIQRAHVERAQRLLAETDLPLSRIASASGFSSLRRLNAVFGPLTGSTPAAYRRRLRQPQ